MASNGMPVRREDSLALPDDDNSSGVPARADASTDVGSLGGQVVSGVAWLTAQKWAIRISGFVTIAILTRLLTPEDFGTLAAAATILPFFYILADLGFSAYIVQLEKVSPRVLSSAFWISGISGILLCGVLWLVAPVFAITFGEAQVTPVLRVLSLWVVITAIGAVPTALLRREMRFSTLAVQGVAAAVVAQVVALILAFSGFGVWALVGQTLAAPLVSTMLVWLAVSAAVESWSLSAPEK